MKLSSVAACMSILFAAGVFSVSAYAGTNDFFGGSGSSSSGGGTSAIGGVNDGAQGAGQVANQAGNGGANPPVGDYTQDEKRMQKKYKSNLNSAKKLISKGEGMMKSKNELIAKKGKIIKEIGEKRIADLKANSPFPEFAAREPKKVN